MDKTGQFQIDGGAPIHGSVTPSGNKNAALPMIAAALLTDEQVVLENVPHIRDVVTMLKILEHLDVEFLCRGYKHLEHLRHRPGPKLSDNQHPEDSDSSSFRIDPLQIVEVGVAECLAVDNSRLRYIDSSEGHSSSHVVPNEEVRLGKGVRTPPITCPRIGVVAKIPETHRGMGNTDQPTMAVHPPRVHEGTFP